MYTYIYIYVNINKYIYIYIYMFVFYGCMGPSRANCDFENSRSTHSGAADFQGALLPRWSPYTTVGLGFRA